MKVEVIGKKSGSFTDKGTGELVQYGKLHCIGSFDVSDDGAVGKQCMIISCPPRSLEDVPVPCIADVQFNQFGRLSAIDVVSFEEDSAI